MTSCCGSSSSFHRDAVATRKHEERAARSSRERRGTQRPGKMWVGILQGYTPSATDQTWTVRHTATTGLILKSAPQTHAGAINRLERTCRNNRRMKSAGVRDETTTRRRPASATAHFDVLSFHTHTHTHTQALLIRLFLDSLPGCCSNCERLFIGL